MLREVQIGAGGGKLHFFCNHMTQDQSLATVKIMKKRFSAEMTQKVLLTHGAHL